MHPRMINHFPLEPPAPNSDKSAFQLQVDEHISWGGSETMTIGRMDGQAKLNAADTGTYALTSKAYLGM